MKMMSDLQLERRELAEMERALHFTGEYFPDEIAQETRTEIAKKQLKNIEGNPETKQEFEKYTPKSVTLPWTFGARLSGLAAVIANCIMDASIFSREIAEKLDELREGIYYSHDPMFGRYVDSLIGSPNAPISYVNAGLCRKEVIKIADFACAPKRGGGSTILFLKKMLGKAFPEKHFQFFGYDIDFRERYPKFDAKGRFTEWEKGYIFDDGGIATLNGDIYYNANNPRFNIVPVRADSQFNNTFDKSHNSYDIIINSMFYSVFEMNGEPKESLDIMLNNLLSLRTSQGILFLNTCDDCFRIYPSPKANELDMIVPFISSLDNIKQKIRDILTGYKYCKGVFAQSGAPTQDDEKRVEEAMYKAHRLATRNLTFLDRLFETYERISEGANLDEALGCLTGPNLSISPARKEATRKRIYSIRRYIGGYV